MNINEEVVGLATQMQAEVDAGLKECAQIEADLKDPVVWACPDCHSSRVQSQMWVECNTLRVLDDTERYRWCKNCEEGNDLTDEESEQGFGGDGEKGSLIELKWSETKEGKEGQKPPENLRCNGA